MPGVHVSGSVLLGGGEFRDIPHFAGGASMSNNQPGRHRLGSQDNNLKRFGFSGGDIVDV